MRLAKQNVVHRFICAARGNLFGVAKIRLVKTVQKNLKKALSTGSAALDGFLVQPTIVPLLCLLLGGCLCPAEMDEHNNFLQTMVLDNPAISEAKLPIGDHALYYRSVGNAKQAVVLWIHGTPGSWSDIGRLLANQTFTDEMRIVTADRPGWGGSAEQPAGFVLGSFDANSHAIGELLAFLKDQHPTIPLIIVGHSWGGSIVPTIATDHKDLVDGAIVLAGSLDPELAQPRWYNRIAALSVVNFFLSEKLRGANTEVYGLSAELEQQRTLLPEVTQPVVVIQGNDDTRVDPNNADFAERHFDSARSRTIRLPDQGHFLQFERTELIGRCILAVANEQLADCDPG